MSLLAVLAGSLFGDNDDVTEGGDIDDDETTVEDVEEATTVVEVEVLGLLFELVPAILIAV